jgi:glutamate/tyrosine decarboxylase-like PLP-dependent enzyme
MRERVSAPLPLKGTDPLTVINELAELARPGLTPMVGSRFFGWVIGASHPAGVAADWLVSAWGQNSGFHTSTPATAAFEELAERWLVELLDLPIGSSVGFATCATVANAVCLAAARTSVLRKAGWDPDADGLFGAPPVEVLIGADAHSSLHSSLQLIGFGYRRVTIIETDDDGRMLPTALARAIARTNGPKIVIAQAGQVNTGCFDPFVEIARISRDAGAWLHVDGAFGLWARVSPRYRHLTEGVDLADSWATDGHKWLQVPYDCGFAVVKDRRIHEAAMTQLASYLPSVGQGDRVPSAYVPELSRRARGVPVYAILRTFGAEGVIDLVERHCALARQFAELIGGEPGITVVRPPIVNQVIVEFGGDARPEERRAMTSMMIDRLQRSGAAYVAGAEWRGNWVMRFSITSFETTADDINSVANAIVEYWRELRAQIET